MPRTLATKRERWAFLTTKPANPDAVTVTEVNAGLRVECDLLSSGTRMSATGSSTTDENAICQATTAQVPVMRAFEGMLMPFRDLDQDGVPVVDGDDAYQALMEYGTRLWVWRSIGPLYTVAVATGHPYDLFEIITDEPQEPSDRGGYIKKNVPIFVQDAWTNKAVAAATV